MTKKELLALVEAELRNRKLKSNKLSGIYLPERHATLIVGRKKKAIVTSNKYTKYIGKPIYICSNYIYGIITLNTPIEINIDQFNHLRNRHQISDSERDSWWPDVKKFYLYNFRVNKMYKTPKKYKLESGKHVFIDNVEIDKSSDIIKVRADEVKPELLSQLNDAELLQIHRTVHLLYRRAKRRGVQSFEAYVNGHVFVVEELKKRELEHPPMGDGLDELSKPFESKGLRKNIIKAFNAIDDIILNDSYLSIVGSVIDGEESPNDIDILIRQGKPDKELEQKISGALKDKFAGKHLHFSYIPMGSHGNHIPIYKLKLEKIRPLKIEKGIVKDIYFESFKAIVPETGRYLSVEELLDKICDTDGKLCRRYWVEPEFAGQRIITHKNGERIQLRDLNGNNVTTTIFGLDMIIKRQLNIPDSFVIDGVLLKNGYFIITDILARGSSQLYEDPLFNRKFFMTKLRIKEDSQVYLANSKYVKTEQELLDAINYFGSLGYKSLLIKLSASTYPLNGKTSKWYKVHLGIGKGLKPFKIIEPLKPGRKYHSLEFIETEDVWEKWGQAFINKGISVEEKYDGLRIILQTKGDKTLIYFEDAKRDRSKIMLNVAKELSLLGEDLILDGELLEFEDNKQIPRRDLIKWVTSKEPLDDSGVVVVLFDILYKGKDLTKLPLFDRQKILMELKSRIADLKHFEIVVPKIAKTKDQFYDYVDYQMSRTFSEGAVLKSLDSDYPLTGTTYSWAKIKNVSEVAYIVLKEIPVKGPAHQYSVGVSLVGKSSDKYVNVVELDGKEYVGVGKTYNTSVVANPGQIIDVAVTEIIEKKEEGKIRFSHDNPIVRNLAPEKKDPDSVDFLHKLAKYGRTVKPARKDLDLDEKVEMREGQITLKEGKTGTVVFQVHERGLSEDQVKYTKVYGIDPLVPTESDINRLNELNPGAWKQAFKLAADGKSDKLNKLLNRVDRDNLPIDDRKLLAKYDLVSIHTDMRFAEKDADYWQGGEIYSPGNQYQENRFYLIDDNKTKAALNWKVPRVGEYGTSLTSEDLIFCHCGGIYHYDQIPEVAMGAVKCPSCNIVIDQTGKVLNKKAEPVIVGPLGWMKVGDGKPAIFKPGTMGATANDWGRMFIIEKCKWIAGVQDPHFKEWWFYDGKVLNGRYIATFVPITEAGKKGPRLWMLSKPKAQAMRSEEAQKLVDKLKGVE